MPQPKPLPTPDPTNAPEVNGSPWLIHQPDDHGKPTKPGKDTAHE